MEIQENFREDLRTVIRSGVKVKEVGLTFGVNRKQVRCWLNGDPPYPRDFLILSVIHEWAEEIRKGTAPSIKELRRQSAEIYE